MTFTEKISPKVEPVTTVMGRIRQRCRWDRPELARESKVWCSRLFQIEVRGGRATTAEREAIAQALGGEVEDLFDEDGRAIKLQGVAR